jgi:1,4-alpha-glucan branching enzyme
MKRTTQFVLSLFLLVLPVSTGIAQDLRVILETGGLKHAAAPRLVSGQILFSYQFPTLTRTGQIRTVAAAFHHENYNTIHEYQVNESGIFVMLLPVDPNVEVYRYRLVVDGVWGPDPNAPEQVADRWGVVLSEYRVESTGTRPVSYPAISSDGTVEFRLQAESGRLVSLVGSFNGWDPYMTPMVETEPGVYRRTIRLTKGQHLYYFMMDGRRFADPVNGNKRWSSDGMIVSAVDLP